MGNSPSQGGIEEHIKSEPRLRHENVGPRSPENSEENDGENRMKTMESKVENPCKASASIQLINKNKVHPAECSYSDRPNLKENLSRQKSCSPPKITTVGGEPLNKLPFSDMRTGNFNTEESVPWADSLIIANPQPVDECSIFSLDSLEKNESTKSRDVICPDTLESIPLMGKIDKIDSNGKIQSPVDAITGSCKEEESNLVSSIETGLKVGSTPSPFTACAETKDADSVISCSFTTDSLACEPSIRQTDSVVINTEDFFTLRETPITDDIPVYSENEDILSAQKIALNINDSNGNVSSLPIIKSDESTNTTISNKEKETAINVNPDADIPIMQKVLCTAESHSVSTQEKIQDLHNTTISDSKFIKPLAESEPFSGEILCENTSATDTIENTHLNVGKVLSAIHLQNPPHELNQVVTTKDNLTVENQILSDEILSPLKSIPEISAEETQIEVQNHPSENNKDFENLKESESVDKVSKMEELDTECINSQTFKSENVPDYEELDFEPSSAPLQVEDHSEISSGERFPIKLQLIDDSQSVLQFACKNSPSDLNEIQSIENINGPPSISSLSSDNDDKTIQQLIESDGNDCESKTFESYNLELREDTDADESSGVYSDLDKDNGNSSQNEYQLSENNVETVENPYTEIKSDNECTVSEIDSPTLEEQIDNLTILNDTNEILHIYEAVPKGILQIDETISSDILHIDEKDTLGICDADTNEGNISTNSRLNNLESLSHENNSDLVGQETKCNDKPSDGISNRKEDLPINVEVKEIETVNNIADGLSSEEERKELSTAECLNYLLKYKQSIESEIVLEDTQKNCHDQSESLEQKLLKIDIDGLDTGIPVSVENNFTEFVGEEKVNQFEASDMKSIGSEIVIVEETRQLDCKNMEEQKIETNINVNPKISDETNGKPEFVEGQKEDHFAEKGKEYLTSVKNEMVFEETLKKCKDELKDLKEIMKTNSVCNVQSNSPQIDIHNSEIKPNTTVDQILNEASNNVEAVKHEMSLEETLKSKEHAVINNTNVVDTKIEVLGQTNKNVSTEELANHKDELHNEPSIKSEEENKEKEVECLQVNEKNSNKGKSKVNPAKPVAAKRVPFSRKLIKNAVKADDAFDAVEIFVGPKRLSLAETKEENEISENTSVGNPESTENSKDTIIDNSKSSPGSKEDAIASENTKCDNLDAKPKEEPENSLNNKCEISGSEKKEATPLIPISKNANGNNSDSESAKKLSLLPTEMPFEKTNICKVEEKDTKKAELPTQIKSSSQFSQPARNETKPSQDDDPYKDKCSFLTKDDHEIKPDEPRSKPKPSLVRPLVPDQKVDVISLKSGRSWIPDSCQHPSSSGLEKESIRNNFAKKYPTKPPALLTAKFLSSQSQQQGCVNSSGQTRNRIMSPSLSNNIYIGMNGIDAEALNALAAQEEQYLEQLQEKENIINELQQNLEQVKHKPDGQENFNRVLAEYEKTLSLYVQQIDDLKRQIEEADEEKLGLIKERDQAIEDLRNVESAFSDVHRKYERAKALLENMKKNEEILVRRDQDMMMKVQNRDRKIDTMKEKVQENMEKMHQDYESKLRDAEADNARLRAQFRKMEMKLSTLENDVEQKAKENAQLSALCDELINGDVIN